MTGQARALFGTDEPPAGERVLTAGPLTAILSDGALRSVSVQGAEVIRGISFLIRDRNWATVVPEIEDLEVREDGGGFAVTFAAHCRTPSDGQRLVWRASIEGSADRGLSFAAEATPEEDFLTCRTGFVVLHPLESVAGSPATIEHTDGSIEATRFPDLIDPLQCFFDIRAISHAPIPGLRATCRLEGGAWETEDHRNWIDASFKTYFRPLALPWPYTVPAGETIAQRVGLTFSPSIAKLSPRAAPEEIVVTVGDRTGAPMPRIVLNAAPADLDAGLAALPLLSGVGAQGLALRFGTDTPDLPGMLRKAAKLASTLGTAASFEIVVADRSDPATELDLVAAAAGAAGIAPEAVMVTPAIDLRSFPPSSDRPPSQPLAPLYSAARRAFPGARIGGGMFGYFTELNRRRPPVAGLDFVQHATAANVHAADDRSVMETLEALPHVFRSARALIGAREYRVGPASIAMAFNPYGASTTPNPDRLRRSMVTEDPRHGAQFGAAYAAGYLARAAQAAVASVAMGSVGGPFAIAGGGRPYPILHVLAGFARLAGAATLQTASSDPRRLLAVAAEGPGGRELWLANLAPQPLTVRLAGLRPAGLWVLDAGGEGKRPVPEGDRVNLDPYAVTRMRW